MRHIKPYRIFESRSVLPKVWYHGTNVDFEKFDSSYMGRNWDTSTLGIYFTDRIYPPPYSSTASEYAKHAVSQHGGSPVVYEVELDMKNPLVIDSNGWYSSNTCIDKQRSDIKRWMESGNNDAVVAYDFKTGDDFISVVSDPGMVKIIKKHYV
jgi:hypothetical protein